MDQLAPLLEQLAIQLGTTTEYLWSVLVRQAVLGGYVEAAMLALLLVIAIGFCKLAHNLSQVIDWYNVEPFERVLGLVAMLIFAGFLGLHILFMIDDVIIRLINPEYWALQQILDAVVR